MGFTDDFAWREYAEEAQMLVARDFLDGFGRQSCVEFTVWPDMVSQKMNIGCTCGSRFEVTRYEWYRAMTEKVREVAKRKGGQFYHYAETVDLVNDIRENPTDFSPQELAADADLALEEHDRDRVTRRITELVVASREHGRPWA